jgi:predicted nucleic acid-binding protein
MKVIDASSMIEFLTESPRSTALAHHLDDDLFAPDLLIAEVHHYFRRLERSGAASVEQLESLVGSLHAAPVDYLGTWPYAAQAWEWRHSISPYDAMYVAMAADLRCALLTSDRRLATAAASLVPIIVV